MPALAPSRQRSPMETTSVPPPDRVPMIEAPPPTSEPSPTTTPGRDPALDHRGAERAGVVVDEPLVHDGGARRPGAHRAGPGRRRRCGRRSGRRSRPSAGTCRRRRPCTGRPAAAQPGPGGLEAVDRAGPGARPHDVGEQPEGPVHRDRVRPDQPVGEQVQPQPDVLGGGRRRLQVRDDDAAYLPGDAAYVVGAGEGFEVGRRPAGVVRAHRGAGCGNQTSSTVPSSVTVAMPSPQACVGCVSHVERLRIGPRP